MASCWLSVCLSIHPSVVCPSICIFVSGRYKCQWIFTKLGMCIDIVKNWFRFANRQILSMFGSHLPMTGPYFISG